MTSSTYYVVARRHSQALAKVARVAAVLIVLALGALCEVAAETHFDPDYRLDVAAAFVSP